MDDAGDPGRKALKSETRTPKEQAEDKLYVGEKGKSVIPARNLLSCLINAGIFHKIKNKNITTQRSSLIPACVAIENMELPITSKDGWTVDSQAVVNPKTGGRVPCHRPKFNDWKLSVEVVLDETMVSPKLFRDIVDDAGSKVGLGDFRPGRKGPFGRFKVTSWKTSEKVPNRQAA